jgi:Papain-like cysteine protease AvrRpt2
MGCGANGDFVMPRRANGRKRETPSKNSRRGPLVKTHQNGAASIIERTRLSLAPKDWRAIEGECHSRNLDFGMQRQIHSNWCWAAVATSIALYYDPESKWTQCRVANGNLQRRGCCGKHVSHKCNVTGHLKQVLRLVRHARRPSEVKRRIPFNRAQREIDAGRPLGVRTQWRGGEGGHFLTIVGYHREFEMLTIADPLFGRSHWHYRAFSDDYRHSGGWKNSYYTKP